MDKMLKQALLFDFYGELLTDHQKSIYEDFVLNDYSLSEIGEDRNISRQGVYDIIIDYSFKIKTHEAVGDLTFGGEYFAMYIGNAETNTTDFGLKTVAINLRFRSNNLYVANASGDAANKMSPKSMTYPNTSVEKHTIKVTLDTINKDVTVKVDNDDSKVSTGKFYNQNISSINAISICAMERLGKDSYLRIEKIQIIEKESDAATATHAAVDSLPAKLADDILAVTDDIELVNADGITLMTIVVG